MSLKKLSTCCEGEILLRSSDSSHPDLGATVSEYFAGVFAMSVLKRSAVGLKAVLNRGAWLFLLWVASTVAQAGGVVVDATRTFTVGKSLSDMQDPPLTVLATITDSPIRILTEVKVGLHLVGEPSGRGFASEIYVSLNKDLQVSSILLNQVGVRDSDLVGFGYDGWQVTFSDSAALDVHLQDIGSGVMTGEIQPDGRLKPEDTLRPALLSAMLGGEGNGNWYLSVADLDFGGTMRLESWSLTLAGLTNRPPVFVGLINDVIPEMALYQQTLRAVDPDLASQAVSYSLESGPTGSEVVNGVFRWTPTDEQGPSTNIIRVVATDGQDASTNAFTVIVREMNSLPTLVAPAEVSIPEGALYTLPLVCADSDRPEQPLSLRLVEGPDGAELVDGVFRWTPLEEQGPSSNLVLVEVTDGEEAVTYAFLVTVREVNQVPVMTPPISDDVDELSTYEQRFSASDDDVPAQEVSFRLVSGPAGSVISNGTFSWTPSEAMGPSVHTILVAADDGVGSVTNTFSLRVSELNQAPAFSGLIGSGIPKLTQYTQSLAATDSDLPAQPLSFWMVSGPVGASVVGKVFTWTPSATQGDLTHPVVVAVSDGLLSVTNSFSLMVGGENTAPRFTGLSAEEGQELAEFSKNLSVADSDIPAQTLSVWLVQGPVGAEVSGGRFVWFPSEAQGPSTNRIVVAVSDGFAQVTSEFELIIREVNQLPVWGALTNATIDVGEPYAQTLVASDADLPAQSLNYRFVSGPSGAFVSEGMVHWTPSREHALSDQTLLVAVDDGYGSVTNSLVLTVRAYKEAPVFVGLSDGVVPENQQYVQTLRGLNEKGTSAGLVFRLVSGPAGSVVQGDRFEWIPTETQGPSVQSVRVAVADGWAITTNQFQVSVSEVNSSPSWGEVANSTIPEMEPYTLRLRATDSDIPVQLIRYVLLAGPVGATLSEEGVFSWNPDESQGSSTHVVRVAASDGQATASTSFTLVVQEVNQKPAFVGLSEVRITERVPYSQVLQATDADIPQQTLSYRWVDGPAGSGVTEGVFSWVPGSVTSDTTYSAAVAVSDGFVSVTNRFNVVVNRLTAAPYFVGLATVSIPEGVPYQQVLKASHSQLPESSLSFRLESGPLGASLEGSVFRWTPSESQGPSSNLVRVSVSDGFTVVTDEFTLSVEEVNQAAVFAGLTPAVVSELARYTQGIQVSDPDLPAQTLNLRVVSGPAGAQIEGGNFVWTPSEAQGPSAQIVRIAVDDGFQSVTNEFTVTVQEVNTAPSLAGLLPREIPESAPFVWAIPGVDSDVPAQTLSYRLLEGPSGSVLANGVFAWTPDETLGGSSVALKIAVSDGELSVTNGVVLSVLEVNQLPVWGALVTATLDVGEPYAQTLAASDADLPAQSLNYRFVSGPSGSFVSEGMVHWTPSREHALSNQTLLVAVDDGYGSVTNSLILSVRAYKEAPVFVGLSDGVTPENQQYVQTLRGLNEKGTSAGLVFRLVSGPAGSVVQGNRFEWTPIETQGPSVYIVSVAVADGWAIATNQFQVSVSEVNSSPSWGEAANSTIPEMEPYTLRLRAMDSDIPVQSIRYVLLAGPVGATLSEEGVFTWNPDERQGPSTNVVRVAASDGQTDTSTFFTLVVQETNEKPAFVGLSDAQIMERVPYSLALQATDSDIPQQTLSYRWVDGPAGSGVTNGVFSWTPDEATGGSSAVLKIAVSDGELSVTNSVTLSVLEVNQPPVPTPVGRREVIAGNVLNFTVGATDADLPSQLLSYSAVASPAGLTVSSNGVVSWRPTQAQGPSTNVVLIRVSDDGKPALSATNAIEIVVYPLNAAPVLGDVTDRTVKLPDSVNLTLQATDADLPSQALTYGLVSGPTGLTVSTRGELRWTPTEAQARTTNRVTVSVSDSVTSASTSFVVVVEASPRLSLQLVGGNSVVIQVAGPAGVLCRLEQAETATGAWTPVVGVADLATQGFSTPVPITIPGPLQNGRLYRLRVL